jgi:hypothetical protein
VFRDEREQKWRISNPLKRASFKLKIHWKMPVDACRVFCACKIGCGKTTIMFNVACAHARNHPEHHVMMIDLSETGDISTIALGGFIRSAELRGKGNAIAETFSSEGIVTTDSLAAAAAASVTASSDSKRGLLSSSQCSINGPEKSNFDLGGRLFDLQSVNPAMPSNMFITVASPDTASNAAYDSPAKRQAVKQGLMQFFENDSRNWVVFIDTDGDRIFTNRTKLALVLAQSIAVPLDLSHYEVRRMKCFTQGTHEMREAGEIVPRIDTFILNRIEVANWVPMIDDAKGITSPFQPARSNVIEIDGLSGQLAAALCPDGNAQFLPCRFLFPEMSQTGCLSSLYGCPVGALLDNIVRLRCIVASEHPALASHSVSSHLVDAVNELAEFLNRLSLRHKTSLLTPGK